MRSGESITSMTIEPAGEYPVYGGNGIRGYTSRYTHDGDFALIGRQGALCGNIHIAHGRFWASEHAVVAFLHSGHVLDWFGAILGVMNLNQYSIAAAQPGLAVERVMSLRLPVPPAREQALIAEYIERETTGITKAVDQVHREMSLLREFRNRLIADVITGKLDVREVAARLLKQAPVEPLDEIEDLSQDESTAEDLELEATDAA
jgi:type I restriction enzyme, S subunit